MLNCIVARRNTLISLCKAIPFHIYCKYLGRCKCNGHASTCAQNDFAEHYCECDHNTAGKDCEKCLPLFNDRPWRRASGISANPCKGKK